MASSGGRFWLQGNLAGRRRFMQRVGQGLLGAGAALQMGQASAASPEPQPKGHGDVILPGRLGNPDLTLLQDIRLDPRVAKVMAAMPTAGPAASLPKLTLSSSYAECLHWVGAMEKMLSAQSAAMLASMPAFANVTSRKQTIKGVDGNNIDLYIEAPITEAPITEAPITEAQKEAEPKSADPKKRPGKLPCIVHIHGGGMSFTTAQDAQHVRWRKTLAQQGLVVVGVEFRNGGGVLGNHPFPAGLNDCASAVKWVHEHRARLNISSVTVAGESGGGNLAVATGLKANQEGWVDAIDGVFAIAPMIFGYYSSLPAELLSWRENEGYQGTLEMTRAMTRVYDPKDEHQYNPLAWPFHAPAKALQGLPPHIITNYELDLIRDDGAVFARNLQAAGVPAISRTIDGAIHVVELAMPDLVPELLDETVASVVGFARRLVKPNR